MTTPATAAANENQAAQPIASSDVAAQQPSSSDAGSSAPSPATAVVAPEPEQSAAPKKRSFGRRFLMLSVPLALVAGGAYVWMNGGRYEETDNANLRQARLSIASDVSGRIVESKVSDNLDVHKGDVLFVVDPEPYSISLAQADAALAQARLNVEQLRSTYNQAIVQQKNATSEVSYFSDELDRQSALTKKGVGTVSALDGAKRDLRRAQDALAAANQTVTGATAALGGDPTIEADKHPQVLAADAARAKAALALSQATVYAPADGVIYQAASFKPGQYVATGTALFALVETRENWIDANFKETQLEHMKLGQPAEVTLDAYPDRPLKATVEAIGAGTGAEFSLLPAQNATGNWVKVTQRIPVRLRVESQDADLMLRSGMSADVSVDTGKSRGLDGLMKVVGNMLPDWLAAPPAAAAE
jgi:membrane fusion protein (multidrug efflux system)